MINRVNKYSEKKLPNVNWLNNIVRKNGMEPEITFSAKILIIICLFLIPTLVNSQENKEKKTELRKAQTLLSTAHSEMNNGKFAPAEADYRKAISLNPENAVGKYNLGTAYYGKEKNAEAQLRFKQAASTATEKAEKHRAFHNLGNTFMNEKKYTEAVEAYKNALRNNPNDDETRYNLALAKDLLEKNPPKDGGGGDDKKQDEKEKDDKQSEQNKQDKKDNPDDNKDSEKNDSKGDNEQPQEPKEGNENDNKQEKQPVPGQLSPQQIKSLLDAMNHEEQKVLEKINAEKQKGAKVKSSKDW